MNIFSTDYVLFSIFGYDLCLIELLGTVLGVASVWMATKGKAVTFLIGIAGMSLLGLFFYQKGLYSSVIQQLALCLMSAWGYINWVFPSKAKANADHGRKIQVLKRNKRLVILAVIILIVAVWGTLMMDYRTGFLLQIFPDDYAHPAHAYMDAVILVVAFSGMLLRAQKYIENWAVFMFSDATGLWLYAITGSYFVVMMCFIYFCMDVKALISWRKILKEQK